MSRRRATFSAVARGLPYARQKGAAVREEKWTETPSSGFGPGSGPEGAEGAAGATEAEKGGRGAEI